MANKKGMISNEFKVIKVVIKAGDGKLYLDPIEDEHITTWAMGKHVGKVKVYNSYFTKQTMKLTMNHDAELTRGKIVMVNLQIPGWDGKWVIVGKSIDCKFNEYKDTITLKRCRPRLSDMISNDTRMRKLS